jgi:nucleotide-binding universal stress UspA family protein
MEKILLAVDGSDHATRAARVAGEFSACFETTVDVINVVPERDLVIPDLESYANEHGQLERIYVTRRDILESMGRDVIAAAAHEVREAGGDLGEVRVMIGRPAPEIASYADEIEADFIIMGRRGLGDVKGMLMGSVSHRVGQLSGRTLITTE